MKGQEQYVFDWVEEPHRRSSSEDGHPPRRRRVRENVFAVLLRVPDDLMDALDARCETTGDARTRVILDAIERFVTL